MAKKGTTARGGGSRSGSETGKARRGAEASRQGPKGAGKGEKTSGRATARAHPGTRSAGGKVGSSGRKAAEFASRRDFGVPARRAKPRGRAPDSAVGLPRNEEGRSGAAGVRTHGVGSAPSNVGSGSGGDLDTDFIGVGSSPVSQQGPTGPTNGPDAATDPSGDFASAPIAPPAAATKRAAFRLAHGAASTRTYDTVDHSGEDANTIQRGSDTDAAG